MQPLQAGSGSRLCAGTAAHAESSTLHRGRSVCRATPGVQGTPVAAAAVEAEVMKEGIQVSASELPGSVVELAITVPQKQVAKAWTTAIKFYAKNLVMEGFRKGKKVPDEMIIQKVGKPDVVKEAVNQLLMATLTKAVEDYRQTTYDDSLELEEGDGLFDRFDTNSPFTFKCRLTRHPQVSWKGDYKDIKVEVDGTIDDAQILKAVQRKIWASLKARGSLRVASQRGVQMGDVAVINFLARRADTGEEIAGSRQVRMHLDTVEESPFMGMEQVGEAIEGMTVGETKTFQHKMTETWWEPDIQGTDVIYEIKVLEVLAWELPEMTDEVAKELNSTCSGVEDLTKRMQDAERMEANYLVMDRLKRALSVEVAALVDVEVPPFYFHEVASNEYQRQLLTFMSQGRLTREEANELASEEMLEQFMKSQREPLMEIILLTFGVNKIYEEQQLSVPEAMLQDGVEQAQQEAASAGEPAYDPEKLKEQVQEELQGSITMDWLVANVGIDIKNNPDLQKVVEDVKNKKYIE